MRTFNFRKGDFVLVRNVQPGGHKLRFSWREPKRITRVRSDWVYEVQNLFTRKLEVVHARRLNLYRAEMDEKEVFPSLLTESEQLESNYQIAKRLRDIREVSGTIQIQIEWYGLPDQVDWTWEPLQ